MSLIECLLCGKHQATKLCKRCKEHPKMCMTCCNNVHQHTSGHDPRHLCLDCFEQPSAMECEVCNGKVCLACIAEHVKICRNEELESSDEEEEGEEGNEESSDDGDSVDPEQPGGSRAANKRGAPVTAGGSKGAASGGLPRASKPRRARPSSFQPEGEGTTDDGDSSAADSGSDEDFDEEAEARPKGKKASQGAMKKVAEVVEEKGKATAAAPASAADAAILSRVKKALALGLHSGGNDAEKKHAMQRATRLMLQHGITHADLKDDQDDISALGGMTSVQLNGLFSRVPGWGRNLVHVATVMCGVDCYTTSGDKATGSCFQATFYGMKAQAAAAAMVYEEAYNLTVRMGAKEYGKKGQARSMLDYRNGLANKLLKMAKADAKAQEELLQAARDRLQKRAPEAQGAQATAAVKVEPTCVLNDGSSKAAAPKNAVKAEVKAEDDASDGDAGDDGWAGAWVQQFNGTGESDDEAADGVGRMLVNPQQLVEYTDKGKLVKDKLEETLKLRKGRKRKAHTIHDWTAYKTGKKHATDVALGTKKLKSK